MPSALAHHKRNKTLLDFHQLLVVHRADLAYAETDIILRNELLVILIEDFLRRFVFQIASCLEHFSCKCLNINISNQSQRSRRHLVSKRTCRRTEHQCIRYDRRTEKARDSRGNLQLLLSVHLINDRCRTAYRLIAERNRRHSLQRAQLMMVDDLHHLSLFYIIHCLSLFIMIYQNYLFFVHIQKISPGNSSQTFSSFAHNRKCPVTVFDHHFLDIIRIILRAEGHQIIYLHYISHRNTLIDQSGNRKSIQRGFYDDNILLMGHLYYFFTYINIESHNNTADILLNCLQMIFLSVSHNKKIIFLDIIFQHIRVCSSHQNLSLDKISVFISLYDFTVNSLRDALVLSPCV